MQETIEKIYRGELYPAEQIEPMPCSKISVKNGRKAKTTPRPFPVNCRTSLNRTLRPSWQTSWKLRHWNRHRRLDGFKLGAKLLVEVFTTTPISEKE